MKTWPPLSPNDSNGPWHGHPLFSLENLHRAFRKCRKRKRKTYNAMAFERNLEDNLLALHEDLESGRYRPGRFLVFMVEKPKRREIFAADFRDRVVHHVLVSHLTPTWERQFIHDSYACRKRKGTHRAVERLQSFSRKVTSNNTRRAWFLHMDIRGFFVTLNRHVLYERLTDKEKDPAVRWLIRVILFTEPTHGCRFRNARRIDFERLPPHKTLFRTARGCGLPIGNLTSQLFANIYLDALDQFVKHRLKAKYYLRYCDDFILISRSPQELEVWQQQIEQFLQQCLRISLNDRTIKRPVSDGIDFLGYVTRPNYTLVRRRVVGELRSRLDRTEGLLRRFGLGGDDGSWTIFPWPPVLIEKMGQSLSSYLAHFKKANAYGLRKAIERRYPWLHEYFRMQGSQVTSLSSPPIFRHFSDQLAWFRSQLPHHILMVEVGCMWRILLPRVEAKGLIRGWLSRIPKYVPKQQIDKLEPLLWQSPFPVAWVKQTKRRLTTFFERKLRRRWHCTPFDMTRLESDLSSEPHLTEQISLT